MNWADYAFFVKWYDQHIAGSKESVEDIKMLIKNGRLGMENAGWV